MKVRIPQKVEYKFIDPNDNLLLAHPHSLSKPTQIFSEPWLMLSLQSSKMQTLTPILESTEICEIYSVPEL